ncbi:MAG TPA: site-specific DNA-methyltransferase [Planctomycetota bacterium]|nr:site-specific DNA-methyltransferase [Planctomycetota bacterium]
MRTCNAGSNTLVTTSFEQYRDEEGFAPLFLCGDSLTVLSEMPDASIDCVMTSPPYWNQRDYGAGGIGLEPTWQEYVANLVAICSELKRVLKPRGSFWLNIGDAYEGKNLLGLPWRVAFALTDGQGWTLRNSVIWNKVKGGMDNSIDKLRNVHENIFHFVKNPKGYFYNVSAVRRQPRTSKVVNDRVVSATGVSGVRYRRQIELATALLPEEKRQAMAALESMLQEMQSGKLADFRMIIRGVQRATHSDSERMSGRARELNEKGFYFLKYHPDGSKMGDVWDIIPEDTQRRNSHFAPYPEDLCKLPILTTCPESGIVLDPFAGTGTTNLVAFNLSRKSVGIEIGEEHVGNARERCRFLL